MGAIKLIGTALSHEGLKRQNNEDFYFIDNNISLFLVADGMGGAASGELASRLVAETIGDYVHHYLEQDQSHTQRYAYHQRDLSSRANTLLQAVHLANSLVYQAAHQGDQHQGMGSTVAVLMLDGDYAVAVTVGDSRVYLARNGIVRRLTVDHRLAEDPKLRQVVDMEGTVITRIGHTLTRAMGVNDTVEPDFMQIPLEPGDLFLLCSDGLSDMVEEDMISRILTMDRSAEQKARDLIELALAGGGRDNITVMLAGAVPTGRLKGLINRIKGS